MSSTTKYHYEDAFQDDNESLAIFLRNMKKLDQYFCDHMASGVDFTLRLELHGNKGVMLHCRVYNDGFERPHSVEKQIEDQKRGFRGKR